VALAVESGLEAMNSAETNPKERDSVSRVQENRLHGLRRGRAAMAGSASLLSLLYNQVAIVMARWFKLFAHIRDAETPSR
jgi:hypothetical protein